MQAAPYRRSRSHAADPACCAQAFPATIMDAAAVVIISSLGRAHRCRRIRQILLNARGSVLAERCRSANTAMLIERLQVARVQDSTR